MWDVGPLTSGAPAAAAPAITTIFSNSTLSGDNAIGPNVSVRVAVALGLASGPLGQYRVTLQAGAGSAIGIQGIDCDHVSIGVSNGSGTATTAIPLELTFLGSSGCAIHTANEQQTSDWTTGSLAALSSDSLVVVMDQGASSNFDAAQNGTATVGAFGACEFHSATSATWNVAAPAGMSPLGTFGYAVVKIETR